MLYKTQGIIIKKANLGEFDRLITIYSKDFGKLVVRGKAVRKNQAKLKGHLELFLYSHLMIAPGRGLDIITGAETIEGFPYLHQNLPSLAVAYYLSELIDKLIAGPEKDINIWQLLLSAFQKLDKKEQDNQLIVSNFESKLLEFLGYGQQKNFLNFVESLLNDRIKSRQLLSKFLNI
jgi:DNA repair protein RecO (recombination protein O)